MRFYYTSRRRLARPATALFFFFCVGIFQTMIIPAQDLPIALQKSTALSPTNKTVYQELADDYITSRTTGNGNKIKENRNKLIFTAVSQIDMNFTKYQRSRRIGRDLFQIVLDILEIGASTAISITRGERPKSIIAEGLTFLKGSRTSVNKNLRLLELQILFNKMIEKRADILTRIIEKSNDSDEKYPFELAFVDVVAYYQAGTMDGALSNLALSSGNAAENAERRLAIAKENAGIIAPPSAVDLRISADNIAAIDALLEADDAADAEITAADAEIAANNLIITAENQSASPNVARRDAAIAAKQAAERKKTDAQEQKVKGLTKLKSVYALAAADSELSPLFERIPNRYPLLTTRIQQSLDRLKNNTASFDDYAFIIPKFLREAAAEIRVKPALAQQVKTILDASR